MKAKLKWLDKHFEESILIFLLVFIAVVELMQVIARNLPFFPALTWAEELCRFAWIATVFLSLPYTIRNSNMLRVSVLIDMLPFYLQRGLQLAVDALTIGMMSLLTYNSVAVLQRTIESGETSPAILLPMWIMYLIVLVGFTGGALRGVQCLIIDIIHFNDKPPVPLEERMEEEAAEEWVRPALLDQRYEGDDA